MEQIFIGYMYSLPLPVNKVYPLSKAGTAENDIQVRTRVSNFLVLINKL